MQRDLGAKLSKAAKRLNEYVIANNAASAEKQRIDISELNRQIEVNARGIKSAWEDMVNLREDLDLIVEEHNKAELVDQYSSEVLSWLDTINNMPSIVRNVDLTTLYHKTFENVIAVNHHPRYVYKAYVAGLSLFQASKGNVAALQLLAKFETQLNDQYFNEFLKLELSKESKKFNKSLEEMTPFELLMHYLPAEHKVLVMELYATQGRMEEVRRMLVTLPVNEITPQLDVRINQVLKYFTSEKSKRTMTRPEVNTQAVIADMASKSRKPEVTLSPSQRQAKSHLLKWLAVQLGSYRIMNRAMADMNSVAPVKVTEFDKNISELIKYGLLEDLEAEGISMDQSSLKRKIQSGDEIMQEAVFGIVRSVDQTIRVKTVNVQFVTKTSRAGKVVVNFAAKADAGKPSTYETPSPTVVYNVMDLYLKALNQHVSEKPGIAFTDRSFVIVLAEGQYKLRAELRAAGLGEFITMVPVSAQKSKSVTVYKGLQKAT